MDGPATGKATLGDYARDCITQRPGLRVRTVDFYRWLLAKHVEPYLGNVPIGKLSTQTIREWRSGLLARGVSGYDDGQGIPAVARHADDRRRRGQDPPA
jgi:hypothetical protein